MKRILASVVLFVATAALSGCYYGPGYGYVRSTGYSGDAYYGQVAPAYYDGGYYLAPGYYDGYYGCCYGPAFGVGYYGGARYRYYGHGGYHGGHGTSFGHAVRSTAGSHGGGGGGSHHH